MKDNLSLKTTVRFKLTAKRNTILKTKQSY